MDKNFTPPPPRKMFAPEPLSVRMRAWRPSVMQLALAISVSLHAAVLGVRIVDPEDFNRVFQDTPLEVVLVNARSTEAPTKAQAIAQANLAGGGEAEAGIATSPLPPSPSQLDRRRPDRRRQGDPADAGAAAAVARADPARRRRDADARSAQGLDDAGRARDRGAAPAEAAAAGRDREAHQRGERAPAPPLHQPGHARRGLRDLLRQAAPPDRGSRHRQLPDAQRPQAVRRADRQPHDRRARPHRRVGGRAQLQLALPRPARAGHRAAPRRRSATSATT